MDLSGVGPVDANLETPMNRLLLTLVMLSASVSPLAAKPAKPERWYQERVSAAFKGKMEVVVPDGRVDIVTATHAIEVEFSAKWKNSIGQALWYALKTGKAAGIVLILEDEKRDTPDAIRLGSVIEANKLPIQVWLWPRDFPPENEIKP